MPMTSKHSDSAKLTVHVNVTSAVISHSGNLHYNTSSITALHYSTIAINSTAYIHNATESENKFLHLDPGQDHLKIFVRSPNRSRLMHTSNYLYIVEVLSSDTGRSSTLD